MFFQAITKSLLICSRIRLLCSLRDARKVSLTVLLNYFLNYFTPTSLSSARQFLAIYTFSFYSCPLERTLGLLEAVCLLDKPEVKLAHLRPSRALDDRFPDNRSCLPTPSRLAHHSPLFVGAHRRRLGNHHRKNLAEGLSDRVRIEVREAMSGRLAPVEVPFFRQKTPEGAVFLLGLLCLHKGVGWVAHARTRRRFLW